MALRTPILDDRSYAQLRDELVARIPVYAPEWTDHHASDPGITLIELFAFAAEHTLYRFNQVPDATRLAFFDLLQVVYVTRNCLTALIRVPTRSVRNLMAPRCSDPRDKGDLVIPVCHNRTSVGGVNHLFC